MSNEIGVICSNEMCSALSLSKVDSVAQLLWFKEVEACYSYLLFNELKQILISSKVAEDKRFVEKYKNLIKSLHPKIQISLIGLENDTNNKASVVEFPLLSEYFSKTALKCVFQPIITTEQSGTLGVECLSRFFLNQKCYSPDFVFSYAQEKHVIEKYDRLCLEKALNEAPLKAGGFIFVNVRPATLLQEEFLPWFFGVLREKNLPSDKVVLEVTEQQCVFSDLHLREVIAQLKKNKVNLAVDDFGCGISNIHLLEVLKPDFLKVSGKIIQNIDTDPYKQRLVANIIEFARSLDIKVIVENVETIEQWQVLKRLNVAYAQGFYFSKPLPGEQVTKAIRTGLSV